MRITLKKVLRDMKLYKGRTVLTFMGVLIGVAAVGAVLSAYAILGREMNRNFMDTNPASMVFSVPNLDDRAEGIIKAAYPDTVIDVKKTVQARISRGDGTWGTIVLRAVRDFNAQAVDTFTLQKGSWAAGGTELMLERDCLKILPNLTSGVGETISIRLPGGLTRDLLISGTVHAPGLAPASMENYSYGFVTLDVLKTLGYAGGYDEVRVVSLTDRMALPAMRKMAADVKELLVQNGYAVSRVDVPSPGKHPHADQLSSLLFLLQAFTVIALLAACLIIVNLMNFIMSRQAKQIAIQKAVGGTSHKIALPYFLYVMAISLSAIAVSIPIATAAGGGYANFAAAILNFNIASYTVPAWVTAAQILTGILAPLLAAAWPVLKSCTASVKDGLMEKVSAPKQSKPTHFRKIASRLGTALTLPASNLMRKKARTALAVLALAAGGVLFMTSQNMTASINNTVNASMDAFKWDYDIRLNGNYDNARLTAAAQSVKGLKNAEIWQGSAGFFRMPDGMDSPVYQIKVAPKGTVMVSLPGLDTTENAVIINKAVADEEKWLTAGSAVTLVAGKAAAEVKILEVVNEVPAIPCIYMSEASYSRLFGPAPRQMMMATASTRDYMQLRAITKDIEAKFAAAGVELSENWNIYVLRKAFVDHLNIIVTFLSVIAMLAVAVGGLGIGSAIGINVTERRHETGVQRAIGATPRKITTLILAEVLLMGLGGWLLGAVLSWPVSILVGNYFGEIFLHTGLNNILSLPGALLWLAISLAVALVSGFIPAKKAAQSPLREMLAYE